MLREPFIVQGLAVLATTLCCAACNDQQPSGPTRTKKATSVRASDQRQAVADTYPVELTRVASAVPYYDAIQSELDHLDPLVDQWDTEAFSEQASKQLKKLAELFRADSVENEQIEALADERFSCPRLRPSLQRVFRDHLYTVDRYMPTDSASDRVEHFGKSGLFQALDQLRSDLNSRVPLVFHFKMVRVNRLEDKIETLVLVELETRSEAFVVQQSAQWNCDWTWEKSDPTLLAIRVAEFEEVRSARKVFVDETATILGGNRSYAEHLIFGADFWRQTLDWRFGMEIAGPHGLAVADVNGDGLDDLFFCEMGGLPNRLYVQSPDGTAEDRSAVSGLDFLEPTQSALFVDLDNDGDQDAVLASGRFILFLQNDGAGRFTRRAIHSTSSMARSMAAADFDLDHDLDVYVCGYFPREAVGEGVGLGRPMPYHDANNGVRNHLISNEGLWNFADVTSEVGLDVNNRRFSYAAAWEDFDNDGDSDLYVANDFGRNNLYRNDNGQFVDIASDAGVEDMSAGMSVSWGDYDRDGHMDIYVGNMFSSAGNRITYQRRFQEAAQAETRAGYRRHARGNTLFRNRSDGSFDDVSVEAHVTMGRWSWSCNFADINNDGWDDLLVGNGMVTSADDPDDL